ncbi:MAG: hypothetical protein GY765_37555 [bacterium]|nr:hypothetical protein [bacterium]
MKIRPLNFLCIVLLLLFTACPWGSKSKVTLEAIDCDNENIKMSVSTKMTGGSRRWVVQVIINVTCNGQPVNGAELEVKYDWLPVFKMKTNTKDDAKTQRTSASDPRPGGTIDVEIKGNNGSHTQSVTY